MALRSRDHAPNTKYASLSNLLTRTSINCVLPTPTPQHTHIFRWKTSPGGKVLGLALIVSDWVPCPSLNQKDAALWLARPGSYILGQRKNQLTWSTSAELRQISQQNMVAVSREKRWNRIRMNENINSLQAFLFLGYWTENPWDKLIQVAMIYGKEPCLFKSPCSNWLQFLKLDYIQKPAL